MIYLEQIQRNLHMVKLDFPGIVLYFSYNTAIAFYKNRSVTIRKNEGWSSATQRHLRIVTKLYGNLNVVSDKEFEELLKDELI